MSQHAGESVTFHRGEGKTLPDTMAAAPSMTLTVVSTDAEAKTATLELRNPEAEPDSMISDLVEDHLEDAESVNKWRDRLHLPEEPVPVDTSTQADEMIHCHLHERLQIGDRVWKVTAISEDAVTLTPGHDYETDSLVNKVERAGYSEQGTAVAQALTRVDEAL
jgi:hypothetical protein